MRKVKRIIFGALAAELAMAALALAAPMQRITQQVIFPNFNGFGTDIGSPVQAFDATLGILDEVDLDLFTIQVVFGASTNAAQQVGYSVDIGGANVTFGTSSASTTHTTDNEYDTLFPTSTFIGTGLLSTSVTVSNVAFNSGEVQDRFGPNTLSYYYTSASPVTSPPSSDVPEPASITLQLAEIVALMAVTLCRRKRSP